MKYIALIFLIESQMLMTSVLSSLYYIIAKLFFYIDFFISKSDMKKKYSPI